MDADKDSTLRAVNERDAVFEVGALLFPQRGRTGIVDGDILCSRHARFLSEEREQPFEPSCDGEVDVALPAAIRADSAAVLPAVSRVDDPDGLLCRRFPARLDRLRRQNKADGDSRQHEQQRKGGAERLFSQYQKQIPSPREQFMPRGAALCTFYYTGH